MFVWKNKATVSAILAFLFMFASAVCGQTQNAVEVVITGNDHIADQVILSAITLQPGSPATSEAMEKDRGAILQLGYFSEVSVRTEEVSGGVRVIYDVVENPFIKGVKLEGVGPIPESEVLAFLRTKPDTVLNAKTLDQDVEAIRRLYRDRGYLADVEDVTVDRENGMLVIPIIVNIVQSIDIIGNKKTPDYIFLREMKTKPEQYFNALQLKRDLFKIYSLDYLDRENPAEPRIEPGSDIGKVIITIPVQEKKTGQVSVGLGYSSRQKLVGRAELTEINFRGRGQSVNLSWEVGGTSRGSSFEFGFSEPWFDSKQTSLSLSVFNKLVYRFTSNALSGGSQFEDDYNERRKGGAIGFGRPINDITKVFLNIRGESVGVRVPANLLSDITNDLPRVSEEGKLYSATGKWIRNTRDFDLDPAVGSYQSFSLEVGSATRNGFRVPTGGSSFEKVSLGKGAFTKTIVEYRRYFSNKGRKQNITDKRRTIALRVMGGVETGTIMFSEQFFVGGAETVRGYREDRFWGTKMLVANAEYRIPLANSLVGVIFVDAGDAWGGEEIQFQQPPFSNLKQHKNFEPIASAGFGIRVSTPIGNLRLDYGIGSEGSRTHFSIGHAF